MRGYVMPMDFSSGEIICIAEVNHISNASNKVIQIIWINMELDYIKSAWSMLGEKGIINDIENDWYSEGDIYLPQGLIYEIFES